MISRAALFTHRSARVVALARVILAAIFLGALLADPAQPVRNSEFGYVMLSSYFLFAAIALAVAWHSWWLDQRGALLAYGVDVATFLAAVYFTESLNSEFVSPFLAFFAYLMLASTLRWNWRVTAIAAAVVILAYLAIGLGMQLSEIDIDMQRFGRRTTYMVLLAFILVWFGFERGEAPVPRFDDAMHDEELPLAEIGDYVRSVTGAHSVAIEWIPTKAARGLIYRSTIEASPTFQISDGERQGTENVRRLPCLFDGPRGRQLYRTHGDGFSSLKAHKTPRFPGILGLEDGLAMALESSAGRGTVVLGGIDGVGGDFLPLADSLAREIEAATDRRLVARLARESALDSTRQALARDLHDSVAQSLAAASFRLEALRRWIAAGNDPEGEIDDFKDALRREQTHVRGLIESLKLANTHGFQKKDLVADLGALIDGLARFWHVEADFEPEPESLTVSRSLSHDIQQMVREGIANAVRHGKAQRIGIALQEGTGQAYLTIRDDGSGIPEASLDTGPRSIRDRASALGGSMSFDTGPNGTSLRIAVPIGNTQ